MWVVHNRHPGPWAVPKLISLGLFLLHLELLGCAGVVWSDLLVASFGLLEWLVLLGLTAV